MVTDDYELLPHKELEHLRREVEHLRKNPFTDQKENRTLLDSMEHLNTSIKKLTKILEGAQDELIKEYSDSNPSKMLREISNQNAKIAEGIIALSRLVDKTTSSPSNVPSNVVPEQKSVAPSMNQPDLSAQPRASSFLNRRKTAVSNFRK